MLVLTRRKRESLIVTLPSGEIMTLTICDLRSDKVKLGVEAPDEVKVQREELYDAKK